MPAKQPKLRRQRGVCRHIQQHPKLQALLIRAAVPAAALSATLSITFCCISAYRSGYRSRTVCIARGRQATGLEVVQHGQRVFRSLGDLQKLPRI